MTKTLIPRKQGIVRGDHPVVIRCLTSAAPPVLVFYTGMFCCVNDRKLLAGPSDGIKAAGAHSGMEFFQPADDRFREDEKTSFEAFIFS
jgi:hypothetical protein